MIALFKALRQQMTGGSTRKYIFYVFSEILLIVIGILLATKINNLNEENKTLNAEHVVLQALRKEIVSNQEQLRTAMLFQERSKKASEQLIELFLTDYKKIEEWRIDSLLAEAQWAFTFDPRLGVLNSIRITGQINSIQNSDIKSFIASFEEMARDESEESQTVRLEIIDKFIPMVSRYVSLYNRDKHIGYEPGKKLVDPKFTSKFRSDYQGLFSDRAIESELVYILVWRKDEVTEAQQLLSEMNNCVALIDQVMKD